MKHIFSKNFPNYDERFLCASVDSSRGRYQDRKDWYEIESTESEEVVKEYCTTKLHPCSSTEKERRYMLDPYYEFRKIGENKYSYYVCEPFCD